MITGTKFTTDTLTSRRKFLIGSGGIAAAASLSAVTMAATAKQASASTSSNPSEEGREEGREKQHATITTKDGTVIYYDDWGSRSGQPVVFSHGWPLSADSFEDQMFFLATNGFRCIGIDRRCFGRSSQPFNGQDMDTYAADLHELVEHLDLREAIHVGHSTGGGEVARYIRNYGTRRVAKAVLIAAVPPLLVQTPANPDGVPISVFNGLRASVQADRSEFWFGYSLPFYGYNRPGAKVSQGVIQEFWLQGQMAGFPGAYLCIKAFSETDQFEDLMKFDIPTLIIQGTDDQIVPYTLASLRQHQIIKSSTLKLYPGAPHGLITTLKDQINQDLLAFA
jgi:non-heme chloroperoxidase